MNSEIHLNIVSFDIPYPPSYGGVIDVYYKIKALSSLGVKIHLHAFKYGRDKSKILEDICVEVCYYNRKAIVSPFNFNSPYIIESRKSASLLNNLCENDFPILFEGLHCSYYLQEEKLKQRLKIVRMHNIEYIYYMHLAKVEKNPFRKSYFNLEASKLKKYQQVLNHANWVAAISPSDQIILNLKHRNSFYLPVFHPNTKVTSLTGKGKFALYHGNLGVGENNEAALFLVKNVFSEIQYPLIIAGSNPSADLKKAVKKLNNVELTEPNTEGIYNLIETAHINILPTFQDTGIKLKLLNALFRGRFCLVNSKMIKETGLEELCYIADKPEEFKAQILKLTDLEFSDLTLLDRKTVLSENFNNEKSAHILIEKLSN